ncbi:unnamed protein product [Ilex paraguariensis]|uniref:Uncharacterized protein n=1 Tax=Ilex paraguariensis TaxID=185542 RepID=A0ABC8TJD7_9AQUA
MEQQKLEQQPIIIAMKGHPGTGKSTLAHSIASSLKCPLIDKDHVRDSTQSLQQTLLLLSSPPATAHNLLNDLSYEILFQMGSTQVGLGLSVVIDSPLSRRTHLDRLEQLAAASGARIVIVECQPNDVSEWRRRLERRGEADGSSWHKPASWPELERLVEGQTGSSAGLKSLEEEKVVG